jgi:class 3 adenylate cyclase
MISMHHGCVVKRTGDGSIIEFRSVVAAPLKNIAEPMRAYSLEVSAPPDARSPPADQANSAPKRRLSFASLAAAIAALLLLAAAGGWYILNGRAPKPEEAAHLSTVVLPFANLSGGN